MCSMYVCMKITWKLLPGSCEALSPCVLGHHMLPGGFHRELDLKMFKLPAAMLAQGHECNYRATHLTA